MSGRSGIREVVVVGGGIAGCTIAYELARRGRSVTLVDRGGLANAASGLNMGLLLNQIEPEVVKIMRTSLEIYREMESHADLQLRRVEQLLLARDRRQQLLVEERTAALRAIDVKLHSLTGDELRRELPALSIDTVCGTVLEDAWALDPAAATLAFANAARDHGAEVLTGVRVFGQVRDGGVLTDAGPLPADVVIIATGPWLSELVPGISVNPARGWCMRTERLSSRLPWVIEEMSWPDQDELGRTARPPSLADVAQGDYDAPSVAAFAMVQRPRGDALLGTSMAPSLLGATEGVNMPRFLAQRALSVAPGLGGLSVAAAWSGIRPMTPDGMPVCGRLVNGVWVHGGHGSLGMQAGPATARWMAAAIVGEVAPPELARLDPDRFADQQAQPDA